MSLGSLLQCSVNPQSKEVLPRFQVENQISDFSFRELDTGLYQILAA